MSRILRPIAIGLAFAGAIALAYATGGLSLAKTLGALKFLKTVTIAGAALGGLSYLEKRPRQQAQGITGRLSMSDQTPQWVAVGETALPAEMIYWGTSGGENKELSIILTLACHPIHSFTGLKVNGIDTAYPTPSGDYAGILRIETALGTHSTNPFTDVQGGWAGPGRDLAMAHFRWTYDEEKLRSGLPQNIQFTCKGIKVYDPRRDSTRGGTGSMRADDESTWAYEVGGVQLGNNPALVDLTYLLGWKKNGLLWAGQGVDPANIDMASYAAGANICDEIIGGTRRRYTINGIIPLSEVHNTNRSRILSCCAGRPIDSGGLLGLWVAHDDTAVAAMAFDAADIVADITWEPLPDAQTRNTARGSYLDPVNGWTAQPYIDVSPADLLALDNGVELVDQIDFPMVTNGDQARALASIRLRESRQGVYVAPMRLKALGVGPTQVISQTLAQQGWSAKKFRVESMTLDGETVQLRARAVQASDYALPGAAALATVTIPNTLGYVPTFQDGATATAPADANRVRYSLMEGDRGWAVLFNPAAVPVVSVFDSFAGRRFFAAVCTMAASGQTVAIGQAGAPAGQFPVTPGERLSVQALVDAFGAVASWSLSLWFVRADGSRTQVSVSAGSGEIFNGDGRRAAFVTAPATGSPVVAAYLELAATSNAAGTMQLAITQPMVAGSAAGQSDHPAFSPGPNAADGADVTPDRLPALPQGNWTAGAVYARGQIVQFAVNTYVCETAHTAATGNAPPNATYWSLFAAATDGAVSGVASGSGASTGSTSYGTVPAIGPVTCRAGATGTITISNAVAGYAEVDNAAAYGVAAKLQRNVSGVWTDVEPETSLFGLAPGASAPFGSGLDATVTGLPAGTTHEFRLLIRRLGAGPATDIVGVSGSIGLLGS